MVDRPVLNFKLTNSGNLLVASYNGYIHQLKPTEEGHYTITASLSVKDMHHWSELKNRRDSTEFDEMNMDLNVKVVDMTVFADNNMYLVASNILTENEKN